MRGIAIVLYRTRKVHPNTRHRMKFTKCPFMLKCWIIIVTDILHRYCLGMITSCPLQKMNTIIWVLNELTFLTPFEGVIEHRYFASLWWSSEFARGAETLSTGCPTQRNSKVPWLCQFTQLSTFPFNVKDWVLWTDLAQASLRWSCTLYAWGEPGYLSW